MGRIYPLFSSSKGNCTYIGSGSEGILIDCGASFTRIKKALEINKLSLDSVKAVFITHEHRDHTAGLAMLTKKTGIPIYSQTRTLDYLYDNSMISSCARDMKHNTEIGSLCITSFATSHDAVDSCGYKVTFPDGESCCVCTDLGYVSETVKTAVFGCEAVLIEANYNEQMLRNGSYPVYLKERIRSKIGHLSNKDCGSFAAELISKGTTRLILGHISQENNTPETAETEVADIISKAGYVRNRDYLLSCAPIATSGGFVSF